MPSACYLDEIPTPATFLQIYCYLNIATQVAGGVGESVVQPLWAGNQLCFVSDRTDFWNIYTETADGKVCHLA